MAISTFDGRNVRVQLSWIMTSRALTFEKPEGLDSIFPPQMTKHEGNVLNRHLFSLLDFRLSSHSHLVTLWINTEIKTQTVIKTLMSWICLLPVSGIGYTRMR